MKFFPPYSLRQNEGKNFTNRKLVQGIGLTHLTYYCREFPFPLISFFHYYKGYMKG